MTIANILPGQIAQSVQPNPKCEGCLHYDPQLGQTGVCLIGLRPWLCGEGDAPMIGYAPAASAKPGLPGAFAQTAQVTLGAQHAGMVKAIVEEFEANVRATCPLHQSMVKSNGQFSQFYQEQPCICRPVSDVEVAKALVPRLTNAERAAFGGEDILQFVEAVRKGTLNGTLGATPAADMSRTVAAARGAAHNTPGGYRMGIGPKSPLPKKPPVAKSEE